MPWGALDREFLRRAGVVALAFSAGLWCVNALKKGFRHPPQTTPVYMAPARFPPPHGNAKRVPNTPTQRPTTVERTAPLSTVKLSEVYQGKYVFYISLYKKDGWLDTHIPMTAGYLVTVWNPDSSDTESRIKVMIGGSIFHPFNRHEMGLPLYILGTFPDDNLHDSCCAPAAATHLRAIPSD